jgi:hypothetical protein
LEENFLFNTDTKVFNKILTRFYFWSNHFLLSESLNFDMSDKPFVPYYLRNDLKHNRNSKKSSETPQNRRRKSVSEIIKNFQKNSSEGSNVGQNFSQSIVRKKSESDFSPSPNFIQKRALSFNSNSSSEPQEQTPNEPILPPNELTMPPNYFISFNDHVYSPKIQETMTEFDSLNLSSPRSSKSSGLFNFLKEKGSKLSSGSGRGSSSSGSSLLTPKGIGKKTTSFTLPTHMSPLKNPTSITRFQSLFDPIDEKKESRSPRSPRVFNKIEDIMNETDECPEMVNEDLGNLFQPTFCLSSDGFLISVSDSFCTLLGFTRNELLQKHVSILLSEIISNPYNFVLLSLLKEVILLLV